MRSSIKFVAGTAALALGLAACSSGGNSATPGGSTASGAASGGSAGTALKVGMAFDTGGRGDGTFNDLAVTGLEKAKTEMGFDAKELSPKEDGSDRADLLRQLADGGYNPIFGVGFSYGDPMDTVAAEYPKLTFVRIDGGPAKAPNVAVDTFAEQEGSYLVGMAAALKSKTAHIGFIGGNESSLITKFFAGYKQGALAVNPAVKIDEKRLAAGSASSGFGDLAGAKVAATAMYQGGADIVYTAAGGSWGGSFPAAVEAGKLAIGVDSDQYVTVGDAAVKKVILTSMVKRVDTAVEASVKEFKDTGKITSKAYGLKDGGVGYSTSGGFVDDIKSKLEAAKAKIVSGEIKVSETP